MPTKKAAAKNGRKATTKCAAGKTVRVVKFGREERALRAAISRYGVALERLEQAQKALKAARKAKRVDA